METRGYFIVGDFIFNGLAGALVGCVSVLMISTSWNMWLAMFIGMFVGMILGMVLSYLGFVQRLGAMEVMLPGMVTGMLVGMVITMYAAMMPLSVLTGTWMGAAIGLGTITILYMANAGLCRQTYVPEQK